jgi:hypothetical protein
MAIGGNYLVIVVGIRNIIGCFLYGFFGVSHRDAMLNVLEHFDIVRSISVGKGIFFVYV